jgi:hypothetical protein
VQQNPHRWLPIPNPSILWQMSQELKTYLRNVRQGGYDQMATVFRHWKSMPDRRLEEWREAESRSTRLPDGQTLLKNLPGLATRDGRDLRELCDAALKFIQSAAFTDVPFISISSWLFATAARKSKGQRKPPNRGFQQDVETIACLLPYCDAMFVDDTCRAYLNELQSTERLVSDTRIFSKGTMDDLINFIEQLESGVAPEILRLAEEVYGVN